MPNYMAEAMAPAYQRYHDEMLSATWGHLHPERDRYYEGYMVFAYGTYGDLVILQAEWQDLEDSPWLFDDMTEYWGQLVDDKSLEQGHVYRFDGTYCRHLMYDPERVAEIRANFDAELADGLLEVGESFESYLSAWNLGEIGVWEFIGSYSQVRI